MLQEYENKIENLTSPLVDIDIIEPDYWVGVTDFTDNKQSLIFNYNQIQLPEKVRFPCVRFIDENSFLVVDSRANPNQKNGWIIKSSGEVISNFSAGDAIQDVVVTKDFIVITYFDESGGEGINIYNLNGVKLFNYEEFFGSDSVDVFDCYATSFVKDNQIIFCPYTEFPLVLLNIETKTQQIWEIPTEVIGSGELLNMAIKSTFIVLTEMNLVFMSGISEVRGLRELKVIQAVCEDYLMEDFLLKEIRVIRLLP